MITSNKKLKNLKILIDDISLLKEKKKIIGFTNGCFDLIHKGHLHLLKMCKAQCDYLIVAINSDNSIRELKGKDRPINNEAIRVEDLSKIDIVDAIVIFSEDNPLRLIKAIKPNKLFKGSDYINKEIVGQNFILDNGGKVYLIDLLDGYSTTNIINNSTRKKFFDKDII